MGIKKKVKKIIHKKIDDDYCSFIGRDCIREKCLLFSRFKHKCLKKI